MIKALIFDFDGLIMDTETPEVEIWKSLYAGYGQEFPLQIWISDVVGASLANFDPAAYLAQKTGRPFDLAEIKAQVRAKRLQIQGQLHALPGVNAILDAARRLGLRLAVASSSEHAWVDGYLHQLGLFEYFEAIVCREDAQHVKPDPELFLNALRALGLPANEALAFEDSPNGILAAKRAGLRVVAVPNPITAHGQIRGASLVLDSLAALPLAELLARFEPEIRPETPTDYAGIRAVEEAAFGRPAEAGLVDLCRLHGKTWLSLVATCSGKITGHILFTPVRLEPEVEKVRGLGIGPIAVLPEYQKSGIGSRLMWAGLEACRQKGMDFAVLLGDPGYYSRFGFKPARDFGLSGDYGDGDEFQVLELHTGALKGISGKIKYVPEFAGF